MGKEGEYGPGGVLHIYWVEVFVLTHIEFHSLAMLGMFDTPVTNNAQGLWKCDVLDSLFV